MIQRPTLEELIKRTEDEAQSRCDSVLWRHHPIRVLSKVMAGMAHSLYGYIDYVMRQCFASTADEKYLERMASEYGIYRKEATSSVGQVTFSGTPIVPAGTQFQTTSGILFETTEASNDGVAAAKSVNAGLDGNITGPQQVTLVSPIAGIESTATIGTFAGGSDAENVESLRERLLARMRTPPRAGTKEDYVAWALEVPGVTRAWCYPQELGIGHVTVRFMTDGMTANGIPNEEMIRRVKDHISEVMPVCVPLTVVAPIPVELNVEVDCDPETQSIREQVTSAIHESISKVAQPNIRFYLTDLYRAVGGVKEIETFRIVTPTDDVRPRTGEILVPGNVSFVASFTAAEVINESQ